MNWFKLLNLLRKFPISDLLNYPKDITDSIDCREWVFTVLDSFELLTKLTDMELDNEVLRVITSFIGNDDVWNLAHGVFVDIFTDDSNDKLLSIESQEKLDGVEVRGFNPVFVMTIIRFILLVLRCIKRPVK